MPTARTRPRALQGEGLAEREARRARGGELAAFATAALPSTPALAKLLAVSSALLTEPTIDRISIHRVWEVDRIVARYTGTKTGRCQHWQHPEPGWFQVGRLRRWRLVRTPDRLWQLP